MTLKERLGFDSDPVFLMDGTAFIYRSFYANRHLRRSDGYPTNALALVTRVLLKIIKSEKPKYFLFAMDGKGYNLRKDIYAEYKANREAMPEDLALQIDPIRAMVTALGIAQEVTNGHEADDCIASLANRFASSVPVVIVSGDKDLKQCLSENVVMWDPGAKEEKLLTASEFENEHMVKPDQWADVQALIGDSSDNIPGVPGIGPKTALQIFEHCRNLEEIRDHPERLPEKIRAKIAPHVENMFIWRQLTTLKLDACPNITLEDLLTRQINLNECHKLAEEFELNAIYREIASVAQQKPQPLVQQPLPGSTPGLAEAENIAHLVELPPCSDRTVALTWPHGIKMPPRLALGGEKKEFSWQGDMADLCQWLANASRIIVPAWKPLLTGSPSWRALYESRPELQVFDLGLASWLLDPEAGDYAWPRLYSAWADHVATPDSGPAVIALEMAHAIDGSLEQTGLDKLYKRIEEPLTPVLAKMQETGFAISPPAFQSFLADVQKEADALANRIYEISGEVFNIGSSQQLGRILFDKLKLPEPRKTKTGQPSTSQTTLEKLARDYPIVDLVLSYRRYDKLRSTYLSPLPKYMDHHNRIHSCFNQEATATGRISSSDPNLQNIPVRGPLGKRMRACFIAGPGNLLIAADYSQIELRVLAHMSQDANLLDAFRHGEDIHSRTAALIFDTSQDQLDSDQRRMAKTINFGLLYGMGARKLAQELKITATQAKDFIDRYFARLSGLRAFYDRILAGARENGFVQSMAGRRRWVPDIHSANGNAAAQAERQAINAVIQGTAADIMKIAMLNVANDRELSALGATLVLQVHDELLLEVPAENAEKSARIVARLMENVKPGDMELDIPLKVDWGTGSNWADAH